MRLVSRTSILSATTVAALTLSAARSTAQNVTVTSAFQEFENALAAAMPGDTIVAFSSAGTTFSGFVIDKPLNIVFARQTYFGERIVIRDVHAGHVILGGIQGAPGFAVPTIDVQGCSAPVFLQALDGPDSASFDGIGGGRELVVTDSSAVTVTACRFRGNRGGGINVLPAVRVTRSNVALFDSAGTGLPQLLIPPAGPGAEIDDSQAFLQNCAIRGGTNLAAFGTGGDGILVTNTTTVNARASSFVGTPGAGADPAGQGAIIDDSSVLLADDRVPNVLTAPEIAATGETVELVATGEPGDLVILGIARKPASIYASFLNGSLALDPMTLDCLPMAPIGDDGALRMSMTLPAFPLGITGAVYFVQLFAIRSDPTDMLVGSPRAIVVLDAAVIPADQN